MDRFLYVTVGPPASGKTTFAKNILRTIDNIVAISRDDIRKTLFGIHTSGEGYQFNPSDENFVTNIQLSIIDKAFLHKRNVIIHDTNLTNRSLLQWNSYKNDGIKVVFISHFCNVPFHECMIRDNSRKECVGEEVMKKMFSRIPNAKKWLEENAE